MNLSTLLDAATASAVDAAWLVAALEPASDAGRRAAANLAPFRSGRERDARERASRVAQLARTIGVPQVDAMRDALRGSPDPLPAIARASMGDALDDAQFLELQRFLDAAARIDALLASAGAGMRFGDDAASDVARALERGRAGKFGFYLDDAFDAALSKARESAGAAQAAYETARGRLAAHAAQALGRDSIPDGEFIVMRDAVAALPENVRAIREAPTYLLCELDLDENVLDALRRRDAANDAVAETEQRVRAKLSLVVRERAPQLEALCEALGEFDVLLAQVRFTQTYACVVPEIVADGTLAFEFARYLPLERELASRGARYEPISIALDGVAVLTGPNMGGKSVALRTCAFVATLAAFGIPVPAASARCALFDEIAWLGIGGEERGGLLSSFASEVVRLQELLERPAARILVLADEFARTTTPHEGKALLIALVRVLVRRRRSALIATHLAGIARETGVRHFAVRGLVGVPKPKPGADLAEALESLSESMDYAVAEVPAGSEGKGDAIALALLLGLDPDVIAEANAALENSAAWTR